MDDIQVIRFLAQALRQAAVEKNWQQVQNVDKQIAALLSALSGKTITDEKRAELKMLQQVHHQVNQHCRAQSEELEQKMALQRRNQEGAAAYAAFMDDEDFN